MGFADNVGTEKKSRLPAAFVAGLVIVLLLIGGLAISMRVMRHKGPGPAAQHFPFGPEEQTYAERIHFQNIHLAEAHNFMNQKFTFVTGTVANDRTRGLQGMEVIVEFSDPFKQVILRDTEQVITAATGLLPAGQHTDFQITLEQSLPDTWNHEVPSIHVTGLVLQ